MYVCKAWYKWIRIAKFESISSQMRTNSPKLMHHACKSLKVVLRIICRCATTRRLFNSFIQQFHSTVSFNSFIQQFHSTVSFNSFIQQFHSTVSFNSFIQQFHSTVSFNSFIQQFHSTVSFNSFIQQFHSTVQVEVWNDTSLNGNKLAHDLFSFLHYYKNSNEFKK